MILPPPPCSTGEKQFILTVDVEEWFQVENLRSHFPPEKWEEPESRVRASVEKLLEMLRVEGVRAATFFVLGWVAKRHPELVKAINDAGFEIASHGMDHLLNTGLDADRIRWNLSTAKTVLEDLTGKAVLGYRAPSFTVDARVIDLLRECGYRYDSSLNAIPWHDRYGRLDISGYTEFSPGVLRHPDADFFEIPVSNLNWMGPTLPWGGGAYFRLIPGAVYRRGVAKALSATGRFVFYTHPWEMDPDQPRVRGLSLSSAFRHYNNLRKTLPRLGELIRELKSRGVRFAALRDILPGNPSQPH